jgi:hypothetical protein
VRRSGGGLSGAVWAPAARWARNCWRRQQCVGVFSGFRGGRGWRRAARLPGESEPSPLLQ